MGGSEMIPVAKAVASGAKKLVDDTPEQDSLQHLAVDSPNMKAAAESYARRVAIKQALLLRVFEPLGKFLGVSRDYFDTQFHEDMAAKVADIPDENLATPSPSVAIPAMLGLSYAVDEPDLKEMYLSLLATATDGRVAQNAHPSFAEIVKQLSPREAAPLLELLRGEAHSIVRLMRKAPDGEGRTLVRNHLLAMVDLRTNEPFDDPSSVLWIDNWIRLGLIEVDYSQFFTAKNKYEWVEARPEYVSLVDNDPRGKEGIAIKRGVLRVTDFGSRFLTAVSYDGVPLTGAPGVRLGDQH